MLNKQTFINKFKKAVDLPNIQDPETKPIFKHLREKTKN